jgi:hypothetical protein
MNEEDYQELLSRANSLIEERLASVPPVALPSNIPIRGRTASYAATPVEKSSEYDFKLYAGDLLIDGSRIRVAPFGVYNNPASGLLDYFMVPNIGGRSIFNENPPTLSRRSGGGAVYVESVFQVYLTGDPQDPNFRARLLECNIVGLGRNESHPIKKAELSWEYPLGDWTVDDSEAKAYSLLGVYDADGNVFNKPRYSWATQPFEYDGRLIPPGAPGEALFAPIKYNITFSEN